MYKNNPDLRVAIVALTRGYNSDYQKYNELIKRNKSINSLISSKLQFPYQLILFHEGNIPKVDQEYIQKHSEDYIKFIDVHEVFEKYKNIDGYTIMCKFQMYYIWKYVEEFDYIIRIDEDLELKNFNLKAIDNMNRFNIDCYFSKLSFESHSLTNETLPKKIAEIFNTNDTKFYNHLFPYTNFFITKVRIWNEKSVKTKLKNIAESELQSQYRWGDLPVLGCFINIKQFKSKRLKKLSYIHTSHNVVIKNDFYSFILDIFHYKRVFLKYPNLLKFLKKLYKLVK